MNRRRVKFYHHAFVRVLNEALQTGESVVFRSHLMRQAQIRLACQILVPTRRRHHIVTVVIPSYERRLIMLLMLLQEWRLIRVPTLGVMVVVSPERKKDISCLSHGVCS
ncbi:hypothetical protein J9N36_003225 [Salmonella enterica]|nr:hypothetical protein [Salmonella enterica]